MVIGSVSALNNITFNSPTTGSNISGASYTVDWENPFAITALTLQYRLDGDCNAVTGWTNDLTTIAGSTPTSFSWDTTNISNSVSCLRLQSGNVTQSTSGNFSIDNVNPVAAMVVTGSLIEGELIYFNASSSTDSAGTGIASYAWDFGDGDTNTSVAVNHTFTAGTYDVVLTVTDYAGNSNSTTTSITIAAVTYETDQIYFEAEIKDALNLTGTFDTGISGLTACTGIGTLPSGLVIGQSGTNCTLTWNTIPYDDRGEYEISIKSTDGVSSTKYFKANFTVYTWQIPLDAGWNLISIPMMPESSDIEDVFEDIITNVAYEGTSVATIFQYDASSGNWYRARTTSTSSSYTYVTGQSSLELDTIVPGYGYWIKMENADTLKGYGAVTPEMGGSVLGVDVVNGWNLIGTYGLTNVTGMPVASALTSLILGGTSYYDIVNTNSSGNMFQYEGYWMTAKFLPSGTTTYTPSQLALDSIL